MSLVGKVFATVESLFLFALIKSTSILIVLAPDNFNCVPVSQQVGLIVCRVGGEVLSEKSVVIVY